MIILAPIFSTMSPTMYFLIDDFFVSQASRQSPGQIFVLFVTAMRMRNYNLGAPPTEGRFYKNHFKQYMNNVLVQSALARRPAWRHHFTVTTLIVPRINNVMKNVQY